MGKYRPHASSIGDGHAGAIALACYVAVVLFWTFGIVVIAAVFLWEKRSGLVRFSAVQAMLLWLVKVMAGGGLSYEGLAAALTGNMGYLHSPLGWEADLPILIYRIAIGVLILVCAVVAGAAAFNWRCWKVPGIGHLAALICAKSAKPVYTGGERIPDQCLPGWSGRVRRQSEEERAARLRNQQMQLTMPMKLWEAQRQQDSQAPEQTLTAELPQLDADELAKRICAAPAQQTANGPAVEEAAPSGYANRWVAPQPTAKVDLDAEFECRAGPSKRGPFGRRAGPARGAKNGGVPVDAGDPNRALPADMRDPPPPAGMF